ncbi:MAG: DUF362 domain-containing protein [Candidatus Lokiarchaeota archaeon]|nr:DUF362 domain-containing protein [Candidatus Lokiarchaeota archaeon]
MDPENTVYDAVRETFFLLGFDRKNYGYSSWNPLSEIISKGDSVLIKPNLVKHKHKNRNGSLLELITHPSIIKAVMDYVFLALKGTGVILLGDAPIQEADFEKIKKCLKFEEMILNYTGFPGIKVHLIDFRKEKAHRKAYGAMKRTPIAGDPSGYSIINLSNKSLLNKYSHHYENYRVTNYDKKRMKTFHAANKHEYLIANSVLNSNVIITIPKLKTHRIVGITCALKNTVGIIGSKDCLPHYRKGPIEKNGDEYLYSSKRKSFLSNIDEILGSSKNGFICRILNIMKCSIYLSTRIVKFKDPFMKGNWYKNDTMARTVIDLNSIIFFYDKNGRNFFPDVQRKFLVITDAIVSGEGDGPLNPTKKETGFIIASKSFVLNDIAASFLMGFDYKKIPLIRIALNSPLYFEKFKNLSKIRIESNLSDLNLMSDIKKHYNFEFQPPNGWLGYVELE